MILRFSMGENDAQLWRIDTFCIVTGASRIYVPGGNGVGGERGEESRSDGQGECCVREHHDQAKSTVFVELMAKAMNHQVGDAIQWREHDRGARIVFRDCHWQIPSPEACLSVSRKYGGSLASEVKFRG